MQSSVANYGCVPSVRIDNAESVILSSPIKPHPSRLVIDTCPGDLDELIGCSQNATRSSRNRCINNRRRGLGTIDGEVSLMHQCP